MKRIEDYIEKMHSADSAESLFATLTDTMSDFGYDKVAYGFATDHPSLGLKKMHGHISSFPSDWMSHYEKNNLIEIDPVPAYMTKSSIPAYWSTANQNLPPKTKQMLNYAAEAGLKDGVMIPLHSVEGEVAGLSFSTDRMHPNQSYEMLAQMQFIGMYFHEIYKGFIAQEAPVELTPRQLEILYWACEGKLDPEIALIMNISLPTVRYHWGNIFKQLKSYGRVQATCKAILKKIVIPYNLKKNYQNR